MGISSVLKIKKDGFQNALVNILCIFISKQHSCPCLDHNFGISHNNLFTKYYFFHRETKGYGTTQHPGILVLMKSAATSAFGCPTSLSLDSNGRQMFKSVAKQMFTAYNLQFLIILFNLILTFKATDLNRNCLLRLDRSIVSMSTTWMLWNPDKAWPTAQNGEICLCS